MRGVGIAIKSGAAVPALLMIPNLLWMLLPKTDAGKQVPEPLLLTIAEKVGLFFVLTVPLFSPLDFNRTLSTPVTIGMGLALAVYYLCWLRFFAGGRSAGLLGAPFLGIPLPMVVFPVLFLTLSSYLMNSGWMFVASVVYGMAHIWISKLTL